MNNPYKIRYTLRTFSVHDGDASPDGKTYRNGVPLVTPESSALYAAGIYTMLDSDKEHLSVFALNNKNCVVGYKVVSTGTLTNAPAHPREIFRAAIFLDAAAIIVVHNHPSGDPTPSADDIAITKRLKECADIFGLRLLDHIILSGYEMEDKDKVVAIRYYSFSSHGLI